LKWIAEARQEVDGVPAERRQVRLETDEQSVQVVTIHKSKGLQYNIVYCPFVWNSAPDVGEYPIFHSDVNSGSIVQDVGSVDVRDSQLRAQVEALAEDVRLLYVALTRSRYRCTLVWGAFNGAAISALAYLLHWWSRPESFGWTVEQLKTHFSKLSDQELELDLSKLVEHAERTITVSTLPVPSEESYEAVLPKNTESLATRKPRREISAEWNVSSFSSLISGQARAMDIPDRDGFAAGQGDIENERLIPGRTFLDFPRGSRAGTALHEIFQDFDFRKLKDGLAEDLVRQKLSDFGFDVAWVPSVTEMLQRVLKTPLKETASQFVLADIPRQKRLHELSFSFPLDRLTPTKLAAPFALHDAGFVAVDVLRHMEQLEFVPVRGSLRGFIDMVFEYKGQFYLVDWKSNYLGRNSDAYSPEALRQTMIREFYVLQYYIYSVALHRYLSFRLPKYRYERHFGGVFYLFLRGIDPDWGPTNGIYYDLPDKALIEDLSHCFHKEQN